MDWNSLKDEAARLLLEKDALHIYAALLVQIVAAWASRRSLGHLLPWLAVLGLELVNEALDIVRGGEPALMPWQVVSGVHDLVNTMILPTVLLLLCRRGPALFSYRRADPSGRRQPEARKAGSRSAPPLARSHAWNIRIDQTDSFARS